MTKKRAFRKLRFKLPKFVRGKNGAAIFLGVALAISASFYVVSAKYSADSSGKLEKTSEEITLTVKVVEPDGRTVAANKEVRFTGMGEKDIYVIREFTARTNYNGIITTRVPVCRIAGKNTKRLCYSGGDQWDDLRKLAEINVGVFDEDNKLVSNSKKIGASSVRDNAFTLKLKKNISLKTNSSLQEGEIRLIAKVVKNDGRTNVPDKKVRFEFKGPNNSFSHIREATTNSEGLATIVVKTKGRKIITETGEFVEKIYPTVWEGEKMISDSKKYFSSYASKDAVRTVKLSKEASASAKSASGTKSCTSGNCPAAVGNSANTKTTTKKAGVVSTVAERVKYSEELPAVTVSGEKSLQIKLYSKTDKTKIVRGPVKITSLLKECTKGGCGGVTGKDYKKEEVELSANKDGLISLKFGVVNVKQIKKGLVTGKITEINRYFLSSKKMGSNYLVRELWIADADGKNPQQINIGSYPFATKIESSAQKFQINGGRVFTFYAAGSSEVIGPVLADSSSNTAQSATTFSEEWASTPRITNTTDTQFKAEIKPRSSAFKTIAEYTKEKVTNTGGSLVDYWNSLFK